MGRYSRTGPDFQVIALVAQPLEVFAELLGIQLPSPRPYQTCAGFLLQEFGTIPSVGDKVDAGGWRFEIVDLDGRRIDKVIASRPDASNGA